MQFRPDRLLTFAAATFVITLTGCIAADPDPVAPSGRPRTSIHPGPSESIGPDPSGTPTLRPSPPPIPPIQQRGPGFAPPRSAPSIAVKPDVRIAVTDVDGVRITIEETNRDSVVVRLPVEIVGGRDPRLLSAGQAIDAALIVPALRAILDANPSIRDWDMPITTRFDVPSGLWQIGLKTNDGFSVIVHIEP